MGIRYVALAPFLVLSMTTGPARGAEADTEADEAVLRAAHVPVEGRKLLDLFRQRTPDAALRERVEKWIEQSGSFSFVEREEASAELEACALAAVSVLEGARHHVDLEIRHRVRHAIAVLKQKALSDEVLLAALRILARRKPPQMAKVLLDYTPYAVDADIVDQLCLTLGTAAAREGVADPLFVRALDDAAPRKRAVAASALCRAGCRAQFPAVRRLLHDKDVEVRRRVAVAFLEAREKAAVPVLIDLLAELPRAESEGVESLLLQLAGDTPPQGCLDDAARGKYRDAWAAWWKRHGDRVDLTKIDLTPRWHGYTLAVCFLSVRGRGARSGSILELDGQGRTRWQIQGLNRPVDAQVLGENRILVTEYIPGQITERNRNGDVLRRLNINENPLSARRLPNGHTFITARNRVFEVDRDDKEVWSVTGNRAEMIVAACLLRGGEVALCYRSGELVRVDRAGKELASFRVGRLFRPFGTQIEGLANGHILVPLYYDNKIVEFDKRGREVWSASYARPGSAQRLPNGRTLVAGYMGNVIAELDKNGREVKTTRCEGPLMSARGR